MITTAVRRLPSLPADRDLPGAADLLGDTGAGCVARFLAGRGLEPHRVEPAQAHYRPGRWLTVCFRTAAVDPAWGGPVCLTVTVECRPGQAPAVWAFPDDPALPGLPAAADGRLVRRRLRPRPADVVVEPLRYRPRRRAVLRYRLLHDDGSQTRLLNENGSETRLAEAAGAAARRGFFVKVLPPGRARRLLDVAEALRPDTAPAGAGESGLRLALPAGRLGPGVLALPSLRGRALRDLLLAGGSLPDPRRLAAIPEALHHRCLPVLGPGDRAGDPGRRRVDAAGALAAAAVVARLLPGEACTAGRLAEAVIGWSEATDPPDEWIVHGDLYENQILVDGETLGLIDLDDLGPGDPLLDAANFSAHLLLLGTSGVPAAGLCRRYRDDLAVAFCRRFDASPADLAWREAYCLLRLASGPFRVLHPDWPRRMADRLALAGEAVAARRAT